MCCKTWMDVFLLHAVLNIVAVFIISFYIPSVGREYTKGFFWSQYLGVNLGAKFVKKFSLMFLSKKQFIHTYTLKTVACQVIPFLHTSVRYDESFLRREHGWVLIDFIVTERAWETRIWGSSEERMFSYLCWENRKSEPQKVSTSTLLLLLPKHLPLWDYKGLERQCMLYPLCSWAFFFFFS